MSVRITDHTVEVGIQLERAANLFLRFLLDDVDRIAFPLTPKDTGRLRESPLKTVQGLHGKMEWRKEYAIPQEIGFVGKHHSPVRRYTTPGTGKRYALTSVERAILQAEGSMRKARLI